ncbi:kinesin-like protein KIF20A isoform X2 [Paramormyrops kingsleyae]|uniref:kinesin-like protein KIF20A isoform X2 n=1 Tax=Paramormyrops kingsleyae TaxID=1676925 RepID=UPI000CD5F441|nr:kinesin-like protein KIF20A isoform X1 [Paramormyrops kingsleyae]
MAAHLASLRGLLSDEEEGGAAVFESTAADIGGFPGRCGAALPEVSLIFSGPETRKTEAEQVKLGAGRQEIVEGDRSSEKVKVYLRIRPLAEGEKARGEDQGSVYVQDEETLILRAPKDSFSMKSSERGVGQNMHKFTFTQISAPNTTQQEFYERTMKDTVRDVLRGENRLLYTYGVTNSGKTYTIQGTGLEAGLLPRALVSIFGKLQGRLYGAMDLKPVLCQEVRWLDSSEVRAEEIRRDSLLKEEEGATPQQSRLRGGVSYDSGFGGASSISFTATQLEDSDSVCLDVDSLSHSGGSDLEEGVQFSIWVSFFEIYNEFLYDLLESPTLQSRKRGTLRLSDDRHGNPYVKDLTWVQVRSAEEAWKLLRVGRRSQSFASTHLNHSSSRSHSIFSIRILHIHPEMQLGKGTRISELTVCDLAGSERCKDQSSGERMKEANNINTSLHTLGRCISALRHNQSNKSRPPLVVPFRDSKLTRVLQGFFCGRGHSCMVVNINPCASTYDETLQALKFSAIATQLVHGPATKTRVAYIQALLREHAMRAGNTTLEEGEEDECSEDEEGDITMFDSEALLRAIEVLKAEVYRQRREKEELEATVREQVCSEMMEVIIRMEKDFSETLETERALMEEKYEEKVSNLQTSLKQFYTEEIEDRDEQIEVLTAALRQSQAAASGEREQPVWQDGPRRSQRLAASSSTSSSSSAVGELSKVRAELDLCQAQLLEKSQELRRHQALLSLPAPTGTLTATVDRKLQDGQKSLRQLRVDLQRLGLDLQSAERACCRHTGAERLRHVLAAADDTLAKQCQAMADLQNSLLLVKIDLRKKTDSLAEMQARLPPTPPVVPSPGSCKKRGCGGAGPDCENQRPGKRALFHSLFTGRTQPPRTPTSKATPYSRVLRLRQHSPPTGRSPQNANRRFV